MAEILIKIDNDRVKRWGYFLICMNGQGMPDIYPIGFDLDYDEKVKPEPVVDIKIDDIPCRLIPDGILPCPLCDSLYIHKIENSDSAKLFCGDCGCIVERPTIGEATERWNTRKTSK